MQQREPVDLEAIYRELDQGIETTDHAPVPFDLAAANVSELLDTRPPERKWIARHILPHPVVAILGAAGGTGKGMTALQLAVATVTGLPWLGIPIDQTGAALMISAEDIREELHRRLIPVTDHYRDTTTAEQWEIAEELIRERLFLLDRVGEDNRLTAKLDRELIRTGMADRIIETARELPGIVLIILDPLSRFDGGDGNDNSDGTRLIEAAEYIRRETGATILIPHHVSKAGIRDPESGQEAIRGASGLVDGARWVGLLATLRRDDAKDYGIDEDNAGRYVRFRTVKNNYAPPWEGLWLERQDGGVLVPIELSPLQSGRQQARAEDRYQSILPKLKGLVRQCEEKGEPLTKRRLRQFGGREGLFGIGEKALTAIAERAIAEGELRAHPVRQGNGMEIRTW